MSQSVPIHKEGKVYESHIPGRVRIKFEILKDHEKLCAKLMNELSTTSGIIMSTANHYTGKVLVLYDINKITMKEIEKKMYQVLFPSISSNKKKSNVIRPNFQLKKSLSLQEFKEQKAVLSNECYYDTLYHITPGTTEEKKQHFWHSLSTSNVIEKLNTDINKGLSHDEVKKRLEKYGINEFAKKEKPSIFSLFLRQFDNFIIKLLLGTSGISLLLGHVVDAATILVIVALEATLGVWQEDKAEKSLDALKKLSSPTAHILRNGLSIEIPSSKVVPGDVILLEAGDRIPADARLIESYNLEVIESSLTGESYPVSKQSCTILKENLPLGDRSNMVYMGTSVVRGRGKAVVTGTGMDAEMGKIASMLNHAEEERTPLQKDLDGLAKAITWCCVGACALITIGGVLGGHPILEMLPTGISLAIGAVPEGLTTVLTIALAFAVQRMSKKNAIVKTLPSVESLSATKVICTDKTGTLTKNEMTVKEIYTFDKHVKVSGEGYNNQGNLFLNNKKMDVTTHNDLKSLLTASALCNNAQIIKKENDSFDIKGDPTEAALLVAVEKSGISLDSFHCHKREHEIPFDSETKKMISVCSNEENCYSSYAKGSIDTIIHKCNKIMIGDNIVDITPEHIENIMLAHEHMASNALRVLGFSYKPLCNKPNNIEDPSIEEDMIFSGLVGMMDPPRPEVKEAIQKCHGAGIKVVMITGDHKKTATAIGNSIGLLTEEGTVLCGYELDAMNEDQLDNIIDQVQIFARTCPKQKLKIVKAFKRKGYIVAMTGDGVNDAPAVKEAHVGISMGKSGTDVTREASSIILTDDNFNTIVNAVEEGRSISTNVKKFIKYVLSGNLAEVLVILAAAISGYPIPLVPSQILMINLIAEGIPALSLGLDPPEKNIMKQSPRDGNKSIFDRELKKKIITRGITTGLTTLGIFGSTLFFTGNLVKAQTMAYANIVTCQMFHALECSSISKNKYLLPSVAISMGITLASIYVPFLSGALGMVPLNLLDWGVLLLSSAILSRINNFLKDLLYITRIRKQPSFSI